MLLRAFRTFWYQIVLCSDRGTLFIWEKLKNRFSKKSLQWSCSNQKTNTEYFHYIYRWTYHKNIIALIQRTVEIYYYPLRPLKWAKTQKLAPTAHFKGYDPTFWAKRHTITSRMISMVKKFYPKKPPCSSRSIPLKKICLALLHAPSGMAWPFFKFQLITGFGFPVAAHVSFRWSPSVTIIAIP